MSAMISASAATASPGAAASNVVPIAAGAPAQPAEKKPAPDDRKEPAAGAAVAKPEAAAAAEAPASPVRDPEFQAVVKKARGAAAQQRSHAPAKAKAAEAQAAAREPRSAIVAKAQTRQVGHMGQAPAPPFNAAAFKSALMKRIADLAPKNLEQASELKKGNKLGAVKDEMAGQVKEGKAASQKPLAEKTQEAPSTAGIEAKPVTDLPPANAGRAPAGIGAEGAAPKPRLPVGVELPIQRESQSLDQQMAEGQVTDSQLAKSNEPDFQGALKSKTEAQSHAASAPEAFRQFEGKQLTKAEAEAVAVAQRQLQSMHGERGKALTLVVGQQTKAQSRDEEARAKIAGDIQNIYLAAKGKVEAILKALDGKVERAFDAGAAVAKKAFEDYVDRRMDEYKDDRYSGVRGKLRWVRDKFRGLPSEVNRFYEEGRALYLAEMDRTIDKVVAIIGAELTAAKAEIHKGQDDIAKYVATLRLDLADVGRQAMEDVQEKFTQLEESVNSKQEALIDTLAQKYQQNLQAVDERIKEMKEANKGLIAKAVGFVKAVIETIRKLGRLLRTVLSRISDVVGLILRDPIGFFRNLIAGLKLGFNNFVANIEKHLIAGLLTWLTGTLGPLSIKMPDDIFSLKGIFSLVMQVLGLTWEYMRAKAVGMFGETVVAGMEKAGDIFQRLKEGPAAVWEYVKEEFNDLKETVIGQIQEMVATEVIKAGVKWLLSMLNPVAAFIKAAMAIYNIITFIVDRAAQLADFILSLMDAIAAIAKGAIQGAAAKLEGALAKSIPLIIGFLASLLGITGLVTKVQKLIQRVRGRIDNAITKLLIKVKSLVMRGARGVAGVAQRVLGWLGLRKDFRVNDESHALYFEGGEKNPALTLASSPEHILTWLNRRRGELIKINQYGAGRQAADEAIQRDVKLLRELTYPREGTTPPADPTPRIQALLGDIATNVKVIGFLGMEPVPPMVVTPGFSSQKSGNMTVQFLFKDRGNHREGTDTSGSEDLLGAWAVLSGLGVSRYYWKSGHMLNTTFGGQAVNSNLVPIPTQVNRTMESTFDSRVLAKLYDAGKVIFMRFTIQRSHPQESTAPHPGGPHFASYFKAEAGEMPWKDGRYEPPASLPFVFEKSGADLPYPSRAAGTPTTLTLNGIIRAGDDSKDSVSAVARTTYLEARLIEDLVARGTVLASVADIKAFIESKRADYGDLRTNRYLSNFDRVKGGIIL